MKNLKKLLAVVLTFAMVLTTMSAMFTVSAFDDVKSDSAYYEAVTVLNQLGIVNGKDATTFGPADSIKRSEAAAILVRMIGLESAADGSKGATAFSDVAADHWASGYINVAVSQGIINGMGDGTFAPDANVTYEQFIKMVMVALGYEPIAAAKGGYPTGYMVVASDYKVTEGIAYAGPNAAPRGDIALIVYNGIDTPMLEQTGWGNNINYEIRDGRVDGNKKTLLTEKLGIVKLQAVVLGTSKSSIDSSYEPAEGAAYFEVKDLFNYDAAEFSDGTFTGGKRAAEAKVKDGGFDLNDNMGTSVILYIAKDAYKDNYIKAAVADNSTTVELVLPSKEYFADGDSSIAADGTLAYWVNPGADKRSSDVKIDANVKLLVNGKLVGDNLAEVEAYFATGWKNGSVRLANLTANSDDTIDIIYATRYFQGLVEEIDLDAKTITFEAGIGDQTDDICLDPEELDDEFVYTIKDTEGKDVKLEEIKENDVLAIAYETYDSCDIELSKYMDVVVVRNTVDGTVTETSATEYFIKDAYYEVSSSIITPLSISLASEGTFYLDIEGKIIARKVNVNNVATSNYAVISGAIRAGYDPDYEYSIRMMTKDGVIGKYEFAPTVKYVDPSNAAVSATYTENGTTNNWAALYAIINGAVTKNGTNEEDRVYSITTSGTTVTRIEKAKATSASDDEYLTVFNPGSVTYNAAKKRFNNRYNVTDATVVFYLPSDDYDLWEVRTASTFVDEKIYNSGDLFFYNVDEDDNIGLAVLTNDDGFTAYESGNLALVTRIGKSTSTADGVTLVNRVTVVTAGETKQFEISQNGFDYYEAGTANVIAHANADDNTYVAVGDTVMLITNAANQIIAISMIYDADAYVLKSENIPTDPSNTVEFVFGAVYSSAARLVGTADDKDHRHNLDPAANAKYAMYDFTSAKTVKGEVAKSSDLRAFKDGSNYAYVVARLVEGDAVDYVYYVYGSAVDSSYFKVGAID